MSLPSERKKKHDTYLNGLFAATIAVAEIIRQVPLEGMSDETWKLIGSIERRLLELVSAESGALPPLAGAHILRAAQPTHEVARCATTAFSPPRPARRK